MPVARAASFLLVSGLSLLLVGLTIPSAIAAEWPGATPLARPWAYWHWFGSATNEAELSHSLADYAAAGLGGLHIVPTYPVIGEDQRNVPFLSPRWNELMAHTLREAKRLGLEVDVTTGTGWPFGGPNIASDDAAQRWTLETLELQAGRVPPLDEGASSSSRKLLALVAEGPAGAREVLSTSVDELTNWQAPSDDWRVRALWMSPTNLPVERAGPGGEGPAIDHFRRAAIDNYMQRFGPVWSQSNAGMHGVYCDSYENWGSNCTADVLTQFQKRRGYDLREHLTEFDPENPSRDARRVRYDYRLTVAELIAENFAEPWCAWARERGLNSRYQAHGSPGNTLDLYALADTPEAEVFGSGWLTATGQTPLANTLPDHGGEPEILTLKLASSAAHVMGRPHVSCETGTWLGEQFQTPLAHLKGQVDLLMVLGINRVIFHGTPLSPPEAEWPGWLWYAQTSIGPFAPEWKFMPALSEYIARCQGWLQQGRPDNDVLVYFPIHEVWSSDLGARDGLHCSTVHDTKVWMEQLMPGFTAVGHQLWRRGYGFDAISDQQLAKLQVRDGHLVAPGGEYHALVIPPCQFMPPETMAHLAKLADAGAKIIAPGELPSDVPGFGQLEARRAAFRTSRTALGAKVLASTEESQPTKITYDAKVLEDLLTQAGVARETCVDQGLQFIRRRTHDGSIYFVLNAQDQPFDDWIELESDEGNVVLWDPTTGKVGRATTKQAGNLAVRLQLPPRGAMIVTTQREPLPAEEWVYQRESRRHSLVGPWQVQFVSGGPAFPAPREVAKLSDWTSWPAISGSASLSDFSGAARYETTFNLPSSSKDWRLDLGDVRHVARVTLNGQSVGARVSPPYEMDVTAHVRPGQNELVVEVANLPANRIAALDRTGVKWQKYFFVNMQYQPFSASKWAPLPSGLLGPVELVELQPSPSDSP